MRLVVCGVRGSTPAPGPDFVTYGGHTSCVALAHDGAPPVLVLDAGTGIRRLTDLLDGAPFRGTILLGHLHWDHTQGLPFCRAIDNPSADVRLFLPASGDDAEATMARGMSPPHFPIEPHELRGTWSFGALQPGKHSFEGFDVLALDIPHKGGRTFGYRVTDGRATVTYMSDHWPTSLGPGPDGLGEYHDAALELTAGTDLLIHDAQYTRAELPARAAFGHAAIDYAVGLAARAGCELMLFHHDPARTDAELDAIATAMRDRNPKVTVGYEMLTIDLPRAARD